MKTLSVLRPAVAVFAISAFFVTGSTLPAKADTTSTLIIGAAAAIGLATAINVSDKQHAANTVVGYLENGDTVYQDGHVVDQNGQVYYPGNDGQSIQCNGQQCQLVAENVENGPTYVNPAPVYVTGYAPAPTYVVNVGYSNGYRVPNYYGNNGYNRNAGYNHNQYVGNVRPNPVPNRRVYAISNQRDNAPARDDTHDHQH